MLHLVTIKDKNDKDVWFMTRHDDSVDDGGNQIHPSSTNAIEHVRNWLLNNFEQFPNIEFKKETFQVVPPGQRYPIDQERALDTVNQLVVQNIYEV